MPNMQQTACNNYNFFSTGALSANQPSLRAYNHVHFFSMFEISYSLKFILDIQYIIYKYMLQIKNIWKNNQQQKCLIIRYNIINVNSWVNILLLFPKCADNTAVIKVTYC